MSGPTKKLTCTQLEWIDWGYHLCGRLATPDTGAGGKPRCDTHSFDAAQRRRAKSQATWEAKTRELNRRNAKLRAADARIKRFDRLAEEAKLLRSAWNSFAARELLLKLADEAKP